MKKKKVSQYHLIQEGIDPKTIDSLKKNKNINPNDVIEFIEEERQD
jgi:hypothetical protein